MEIKIQNITNELYVRINDVVKHSKNNESYLQSIKHEIPLPHYYVVILAVIYLLVFFNSSSWSFQYILIFSGPVVTYFISREFQKLWNWWFLGRDSVFFDSKYFMSIIKDEVNIQPLNEFTNADIILAEDGTYDKIRFHFTKKTIILPYDKESEVLIKFHTKLVKYSNLLKDTTTYHESNQNISFSILDKISIHKPAIIASFFFFVLLWFVVPQWIDLKQYNEAVEFNTASSYRIYLSESRNVNYREKARTEIKGLYDKYINAYMTVSSNLPGANAFKEVLLYLRDKELYTIEIVFNPSSQLHDLPSKRVNILPVTPSFTNQKNYERHTLVINSVKNSLLEIFPTDIIEIVKNSPVGNIPRFEVNYIYEDNPKTIYYPTEEINLPENKRKYYYGIIIEWNFRLFLKTETNPIYKFELLSSPAEHFSSNTLNSDDVYSNMAASAFNDFELEFKNRFLPQK